MAATSIRSRGNEHRNDALRARLIIGVCGEHGNAAPKPFVALVAEHLADVVLVRLWSVLDQSWRRDWRTPSRRSPTTPISPVTTQSISGGYWGLPGQPGSGGLTTTPDLAGFTAVTE